MPEPPDTWCDETKLMVGGRCEPMQVQWVHMPFPDGEEVRISQCFYGRFSHTGDVRFAIDFPAEEGTPFVAVKDGVVVDKYERSSGRNKANYVILDHGDGTLTRYFHLVKDGVDVEVGDQVCQGELLGRTGNTGNSSGPHLHLDLVNTVEQTVPLLFVENQDLSGGHAFPFQVLPSENAPVACGRDVAPTVCQPTIFEFRGITLDEAFTCGAMAKDVAHVFTGRSALPEKGAVMTAVFDDVERDWEVTCHAIGEDGRFSVEVTWDSETHDTQRSRLIIEPAEMEDGECTRYSSWESSAQIYLR